MNISYIICAAGLGSRFQHVSQNISKAFLKLQGKTLLERSIESLTFDQNDEIVIVHRFSEEEVRFAKEKIFLLTKIKPIFIKLNHVTSGQAETALFAKNYVSCKKIAIFNIDTFFRCRMMPIEIEKNLWDGIIPCFKANGESWSFFETESIDDQFIVKRSAEKTRISQWASVGLYYFKDSELIFDLIREEIEKKSFKNELYVAPFYNHLIKSGKKCIVIEAEIFKPMGTVNQIGEFWNVTENNFAKENSLSG